VSDKIDKFLKEREYLNNTVMKYAGLNTKRFFNLDSAVYKEGKLPRKVKEMMGLVASMVLRCDDCITYHLIQCKKFNVSDEELEEALSVALIVGGSIVIPHLRRAFEQWDKIEHKKL